jgi:hypothetical protein
MKRNERLSKRPNNISELIFVNCVHTSTTVKNSGYTFRAHSFPSKKISVYTIEFIDVHDL